MDVNVNRLRHTPYGQPVQGPGRSSPPVGSEPSAETRRANREHREAARYIDNIAATPDMEEGPLIDLYA